jgi:16S rRNA (cytosine967-C5)-methyltransferase
LRRNPEIRWRLSPDDIPAFVETQKQILRNAMEAVKPGGVLVYSTCSVEREENEEVVAECDLHPLTTIRTWPHRDACDGFFIASFRRT